MNDRGQAFLSEACERFEISEADARTDPRAAVLSLDARRFPRERITPNGA